MEKSDIIRIGDDFFAYWHKITSFRREWAMLLLGLPNCPKASFVAEKCAAFNGVCEKIFFPVVLNKKTALILDFLKI